MVVKLHFFFDVTFVVYSKFENISETVEVENVFQMVFSFYLTMKEQTSFVKQLRRLSYKVIK